jgi:hypothetical protein
MKKQTSIKELAHDYFRRGQLNLVSPDSESAYIEAMNFAQEFISFDKEVPEIKKKRYDIIVKGKIQIKVNGKTKIKNYYEIFSIVPGITKEDLIEIVQQFGFTHWRPLFYKEK